MALPFALMYRPLASDFTVYVFSRRRELPEHMTTREMAADLDEGLGHGLYEEAPDFLERVAAFCRGGSQVG